MPSPLPELGRSPHSRVRAPAATTDSIRYSTGARSAARGLAVVSDDGPLLAAIDEALAAQQGVADKIRGGKLQAAGAIVGAVMKATGGKADAGRVRELILQRVGVDS